MAARTLQVPNATAAAYEGLVEDFRNIAEEANCGTVIYSRPPRSSFDSTPEANRVAFDCLLYLRGLRWRSSSHSNETVDVLLRAREKIQLPELALIQSTVCVNYFVVEESEAKLVECVHYDYVHPPQNDQHPVFHAQFATEPIVPDAQLRAQFDYTIDVNGLRCFQNVRIPTADMTLSSVLLSIAADHFGNSFFNQFRARFHARQDRFPRPVIDDLRWSLGASITHLKSWHWFARQPQHAS